MTEFLFYHLQRQPVERVLPTLIEKSLERGWRVVVQAASEERVEALDAQLWTFREDSFLPHGTWREAEAREQPVLLTVHDDNPNGAAVRFLIDGAPVPADAEAYARIVLIFDGGDPDAVGSRASAGARAGRRGSTSPTGRPTRRGAGSASNELRAIEQRGGPRRFASCAQKVLPNEKPRAFARGLSSSRF